MKYCWIFCCLMSVSAVQAAELEGCAAAEVTDSQGQKVTFWQHKFEHGTRDLVMAQPPSDLKRVTFNHAQSCYQALVISEGKGWGWHLAWADAQKVYYARMDGGAWVSSVPKKFAVENARELRFTQIKDSQDKNVLTLSWQAVDSAYQMQSDDEGRSWDVPTKK